MAPLETCIFTPLRGVDSRSDRWYMYFKETREDWREYAKIYMKCKKGIKNRCDCKFCEMLADPEHMFRRSRVKQLNQTKQLSNKHYPKLHRCQKNTKTKLKVR